jgi:hypothetical protein
MSVSISAERAQVRPRAEASAKTGILGPSAGKRSGVEVGEAQGAAEMSQDNSPGPKRTDCAQSFWRPSASRTSLHLVPDVADFALNVDAKDVLARVPHQSSRLPIKRNTVSRKLVGVQSGIEPIDQFFIGQLGIVATRDQACRVSPLVCLIVLDT